MICELSGRDVEVCFCGNNHYCRTCKNISPYEQQDRDDHACRCEDDDAIADSVPE